MRQSNQQCRRHPRGEAEAMTLLTGFAEGSAGLGVFTCTKRVSTGSR
ncbi:MAG: hypothetical protein L3J33_04795 [Rhodobacteraceae bacterium]|nr:hypothetical protein [Paracoccaceae bacterium]